MRRYCVIILLSLVAWTASAAQRLSVAFEDVSLAEALRTIDHAQTERNIVFVLNDLEDLRVTCNIRNQGVMEAVQTVCGGYPILITEDGDNVFVEYVRPPMRLLPQVLVSRRHIQYDDDGYTVKLHNEGMAACDMLSFLPSVSMHEGRLHIHGERVREVYLDGMRLADADELRQLESGMIDEVRVDTKSNTVHIRLRRPRNGGYYGSLYADGASGTGMRRGETGGVWYSRYHKTSVYDKLDVGQSSLTDEVRQSFCTPQSGQVSVSHNQLYANTRTFSNRLSLVRELTPRHEVGFSYYLADKRGKAQSVRDDHSGFIDFSGRNQHIDQELTLKLTSRLGPKKGRLEVLADLYDRHTTSENTSLYGAGVGTDMGEAPAITLCRLSADVDHPVAQHLTMYYGMDSRYFVSQYDPQHFLSNFNGSPTLLNNMMLRGSMQSAHYALAWKEDRLKVDGGVHAQWYRMVLKQQDESSSTQGGTFPHLSMSYSMGSTYNHRLTMSYQSELGEMPYAVMSPTVRWNDAYNYSIGNPELKTPVSRRLMVGTSLWRDRLNLTILSQWMENDIYWQSHLSSGQKDVFYTQAINLPSTRQMSVQAELNLQPTAWWNVKLEGQWMWRLEDETIAQIHYDECRLRQHYAWRNHLEFGRGWMAQVHALWQPEFGIYDRTCLETYQVGGEVRKMMFDRRLHCALSFSMVNHDRTLIRQIEDRRVDYHYLSSPWQIGLRVSWRFDGGRHVEVGTIQGGQRYHEVREMGY